MWDRGVKGARRVTSLVVALGLAAAACTQGSVRDATVAGEGERPGVSATEPREEAPTQPDDEVRFPLDTLLALSWEDRRSLILAEETLVATCMRAQGWPYEIPPVPVSGPGELPDRRYGATSRDLELPVSPGGRGDAGADTTEPLASAGGGLPEGLDPEQADAWQQALSGDGFIWVAGGAAGIPAGGCVAQAQETLYGDRVARSETFYRIQGWIREAFRSSRSDPEVVAALARWQACMDKAGWVGYEDPLELATAFAVNGIYDPRIRADVECKKETGLVGVWSRVESRYQEQLLAEHEAEILAWVEQRDRALERAREVVGGAG